MHDYFLSNAGLFAALDQSTLRRGHTRWITKGTKHVVCCEVLEHLEFPDRDLAEISRDRVVPF